MSKKDQYYDRVVFPNGFACFGNNRYRGGGEYCDSSKKRALAVRALQFLLENGGSIRQHEYGYWMDGPFGSEFVSDPIDLAKRLGFKKGKK